MNDSWLKIHRRFLDWEWFDKSEMVQLFIFFLLNANFEDKSWRGTAIKRGQLATSIDKISIKTHLSKQVVRTCINRLKSTHEITTETTNHFTIVTICKYDCYQETKTQINTQNNKQINKPLTNNQQTDNKRITTTKEIKNIRNKEIKNIKNNKKDFDFSFCDSDFLLPIKTFLNYRTEIKKPLRAQKSIEGQYEKLKKLSGGNFKIAIKIVEQTISEGWQGLFELKSDAASLDIILGSNERIENGRRTYGTGKATIPMNAPPRPSERHAWDSLTQKWIML